MRVAAAYVVLSLAGAIPAMAAPAPDAGDGDWTLASLMAGLSQVKSASARFTEHKYVHMLTRPLESSGTLTYAFTKVPGLRTMFMAGTGMYFDNFMAPTTPGVLVLHGYGCRGVCEVRGYDLFPARR